MQASLIETVRVRGGVAPLWYLHLRRLAEGCRALGVPLPLVLDVPGGGPDRAVRIEVGADGARVAQREVGSLGSVRLVTAATPHRPYPHKTTDRAVFNRAADEAGQVGADDALLLTVGGYVAEACIWNVFWWEGDALCTPALDMGVLYGVARRRLEELTAVAERRSPRAVLAGRSLFLTNAVRGIVPVASLDGDPVPEYRGTAALAERFWA